MNLRDKTKKARHSKFLDQLTYLGGILLPIMTLPQAYDIWIGGRTDGVSAITWILYTAVSLLFLLFGIRHKENLFVLTYLPMFAVEVVVVAGLFSKA